MTGPTISRRNALLGAAGLGVGVPALAACGSSAGSDAGMGTQVTGTGPLVATADVPVGGGVILQDRGVVVTQPTAGVFKCFSDICTHLRCPVTSVGDGTINCTCHGSRFSITDGSVEQGPATQPLPEISAKVQGGQVVAAASTESSQS